jgi:hypothetical protein
MRARHRTGENFCALALITLAVAMSVACSSNPPVLVAHAAQSCLNFQSPTSYPDIHGEGVCQLPGSSNVYTLMWEIGFTGISPPEPNTGTLQVTFPSNKTITQLNGTLSYYSDCPWGDTLIPPNGGVGNVALVRVYTSTDPGNPGTRVPSYTWVIKNGATSGTTVFINDSIPIPTGDGNGSVEVFTGLPIITPPCFLTMEFQGHMNIQ